MTTKVINTNDLILVPSTNITREGGKAFNGIKDRATLAHSLALNGFDVQYGTIAVVEIAACDFLADTIVGDGMAYREALPEYVEELKFNVGGTAYDLAVSELELSLAKTFTNKKAPKYLVLDGNRRTESLLLANAMRSREGLELITKLPVKVVECQNMADFYALGMQYNCSSVGKRNIKDNDKLRAAKAIFDKSGKESDVQKALGNNRGMAQKLWGIVKINSAMPELGFYDKCMADSKYLSAVDRAAAGKLGRRVTAYERPEDEDLLNDVTELVTKQTKEKTPKVMNRTTLEELRTSPVKIVREIVKAVLDNDKDSIIAMADLASELNEAYDK